MRLANAPVINADVMIANIIWYAMNTNIGIFALPGYAVFGSTPRRARRRGCQ